MKERNPQKVSGFQLEVTGGLSRREKGEPSEIGIFPLVLIGNMWART